MSTPRDEQPPEPGPANSPTATRPGRRRTGVVVIIAVALVVGIGIGGLTGYLVFGTGDSVGESPAAEVDAACQIAERLAESHDSADDWGPIDDDPAMWQAQAVSGLLSAAAIRDEQYDQLAEDGIDLLTAVTRLDRPGQTEEIQSVAERCANL